jgi:hypothetical protein
MRLDPPLRSPTEVNSSHCVRTSLVQVNVTKEPSETESFAQTRWDDTADASDGYGVAVRILGEAPAATDKSKALVL